HLTLLLSPEVAQEVADVTAAPLSDAPYQRLKQSILDHTMVSERTHAYSTCSTPRSLADGRPSQLLNTMRQFLAQATSTRAMRCSESSSCRTAVYPPCPG
ncbi:hypothetical protein MTO96_050338, partial [Rhipicephalus appendiculatus]